MAGYHRLDLVWIDLESGNRDHVLLAVDDPNLAQLVDEADITGAEITVRGHDRGGFVRELPIAGHDLRTAGADFPGFAERDLVVVIVANRDVRRRYRQPNRAAPFGCGHEIAGQYRRSLR